MSAVAIAAVQRRVSHITHMAESNRTHTPLAQSVSHHSGKVCVWTQRKGWGMGKVLHLDELLKRRARSVAPDRLSGAVDVVKRHREALFPGELDELAGDGGRDGLATLVKRDVPLRNADGGSDFRLGCTESGANSLESIHGTNISRPDAARQQSDCLISMSRPHKVRRMPAKDLSPEQLKDAERLKAAFKLWQAARRSRGEPSTQDEVAETLFGFGQSALSQYLNGTIPLNFVALTKFSKTLGVPAATLSPTLVAEAREKRRALEEMLEADDREMASAINLNDRAAAKRARK